VGQDAGVDLGTLAWLAAAGFIGAAMNGVVGAGTLITFPALLAAGAPPVIANGTNTLGLSVGSWSSAIAYRRELTGRAWLIRPALIGSAIGAMGGAILVIALPEAVFAAAVPWLILTATLLVATQPLIARRMHHRSATKPRGRGGLTTAIAASGIYGGYFGAGQGVVLMAVLGWLYDSSPQHANAAKNLFAATANITAALVFAISGRVWWWAALVIAVAALPGGTIGARAARRLRPAALRFAVVLVGLIATFLVWVRW
jgi:uncharacterized membrane protein YfcA